MNQTVAVKDIEIAAPEAPMPPPPEVTEGARILSLIEQVASSPDAQVETLERLFQLQENVRASDAKRAFSQALRQCQAEIEPVVKDKDNDQTKSKYSSHVALDGAIRPIYNKHGFSVSFNTAQSDKDLHVRVLLLLDHDDGHSRTYEMDVPADGKGAKGGAVMSLTHAAQSAQTYGKRNLLKLAFNIVEKDRSDDDGNAASGGLISDEQAQELTQLITATKAQIAPFLKLARAESVADIRASDFKTLKQFLIMKKQNQAAKNEND